MSVPLGPSPLPDYGAQIAMAAINFHCPECLQRIVLDDCTTALEIECPLCQSVVRIPAPVTAALPQQTLLPACLVTEPGTNAQTELVHKEQELAQALDEAARCREETRRSHDELRKLQEVFTATNWERNTLRDRSHETGFELNRLRGTEDQIKSELADVRAKLVEAIRDRDSLAQRLEQFSPAADELRTEEIARLRNECAELGRDLSAARGERDATCAEMAAREEAMRKASGTVDAARQELDRLRCEQRETIEDNERLKSALAEGAEDSRELQERVDGLLDNLHQRERELAEARQDRAAIETELERVRTQSAQSFKALEEAKAQNAAAQQELARLQDILVESSAAYERVANALVETEQKVAGAAERIAALEEEGRRGGVERNELEAQLRVSLHQREEALHQLANKNAELQDASTRFWEEGAAANERIAELERRLGASTQEARVRRDEFAAVRTELDETLQQLAVREVAMREISAQLERKATGEHTLRLHLAAAERNAAAARERARVLQTEHEAMEAEVAITRAMFDQLQNQVSEAGSERDSDRERMAAIESELERTLERLHAGESERELLKGDLEATRAGLDRAKEHINALQSRRDQMREEIARLKMQLGLAPDAV